MSPSTGTSDGPFSVLYIEQFGLGGLVHYAHCLCDALAQRRHQVALLTSFPFELYGLPRHYRLLDRLRLWDPFDRDPARERGLRRWRQKAVKAMRYAWGTATCLWTTWRERPDVIHTSEMKFLLDLALYFFAPATCTIVHTCHNVQRFSESRGSAVVRRSRIWQWAQSCMYRRTSGVIFHAAENREEFRAVFGFLPQRSAVIPHGEYGMFLVGEPPTAAEARRALGLKATGPVVLFFGALRRYKGLDVLLRAFVEVARQRSQARLIIAGAPLRDVNVPALQALACRLGISEHVIWRVGYVPHESVHLYFHASDVVVYPYRKAYESGALRIAQALGRPVVVTDTGGLASAVAFGAAGLIAEPENAESIAQAVMCLLTDADLVQSVVSRGFEMSRTTYAWNRVALMTERFYQQLVDRRCV